MVISAIGSKARKSDPLSPLEKGALEQFDCFRIVKISGLFARAAGKHDVTQHIVMLSPGNVTAEPQISDCNKQIKGNWSHIERLIFPAADALTRMIRNQEFI